MDGYIGLAAACAVCFGIGNSMQKHGMAAAFPQISLRRFAVELPRIVATLLKNWVWLVGLGFAILGFICQGKSIDAPESKLAVIMPLLNLSTLVTSVIGVFLFKEKVAKAEWGGIAVITFGSVLVCAFDRGMGASGVNASLLKVCYGVGIVFMAALAGASTIGPTRKGAEMMLAVGSGLGFGMGAVALKMLDLDLKVTAGGFNVTDPQFLVTFLTSANGWMLIVFNLAGFALFQLSFAHGRISLVGPFSQVFAMVIPVMAGVLAFRESLVAWQWVGIAIVAVGTFAVRGE